MIRCRVMACLLALAAAAAAAEPPVVALWPGVAPGSEGVTIDEKWVERGKSPRNRTVTSITRPAMPRSAGSVIAATRPR